MLEFTSFCEQETEQIAYEFAKKLCDGDVIAYRGGLGAGKTAFTRGLALGLGIAQDVCSPTFALVNEYRGNGKVLCHFDMYRVNGYDSLYSTGFFDYLNGENILAIEWSENIEDELPDNTITITITVQGEQKRHITVEGGARF